MQKKQNLLAFENHFSDLDFSDIALLYNGRELCVPGKANGPHVLDHYLFHLVIGGKGALTLDDRTYPLQASQGFFIAPGQLFRYQADGDDPWEYLWFGFKGRTIPNLLHPSWLLHTQPIYASPNWHALWAYMNNSFETMHKNEIGAAIKCQGLLYLSLAHLLEETKLLPTAQGTALLTSVQQQYIFDAIEYIRQNIGRHFTVRDVAAKLGLNRSYFSRLFTAICGSSPVLFISKYRLDIAWHMIRYANMPIRQVAQAVGFEDTAYFTRCFNERYGQTPSQVRSTGNVGHQAQVPVTIDDKTIQDIP